MSWSKVNEPFDKPIGWWYYKIMCEFYYWRGNHFLYYRYLNEMINKYKITLYGDKIKLK